MQAKLARHDFTAAVLFKTIKNRRIEQLKDEKERLDYERKILQRSVELVRLGIWIRVRSGSGLGLG